MSRLATCCLFLSLILVSACSQAPASAGPSGATTGPSATAIVTPSPTSVPASEAPTPTPTPSVPISPSPAPSTPAPTPTSTPLPSPTPPATMIVRAYFFLDDAVHEAPAIVPVLRTVPTTEAVARAAMLQLLAGPDARERAADPVIHSMIPKDVELLGLEIQAGTATVDLSDDFAAGGGSLAMRGRLAQVTWTLTQFSSVERVAFAIEGEPVTSFSSEGLLLKEPLTRASYRDAVLPPIYVDRPAWGAASLTPGRVTGVANVFEGQFRIGLLDERGHVLIEREVHAACGTGCWGRFEVTLEYEVEKAQWGTLRVWDPSEGDGEPEALRDYPMYLRPADD